MGNHESDSAKNALRAAVAPEVLPFLDYLGDRLYPEARRHAQRIGLAPIEAELAARAIVTTCVKTMVQHVQRVKNRELGRRIEHGGGKFT